MARERLDFMDSHAAEVDTIIDGSPDPVVVERAVRVYTTGLTDFVYPDTVAGGLSSVTRLPRDIRTGIESMRRHFISRVDTVTARVATIVTEINQRAAELRSERFSSLQVYDRSLWAHDGENGLLFGVLACVDRGVPSSAVVGIDGAMGRTLGGDIEIDFIPSHGGFVLGASEFTKKVIHTLRQGHTIVEPMIEHTGCGRRGQIMANEFGSQGIPKTESVIKNLAAVSIYAPYDDETVSQKRDNIRNIWYSYQRDGQGVKTPDGGLFAGVLTKLAQRSALYRVSGDKMISPVEIYDKVSGDLLVGVDNIDVLSDEMVITQGGFTQDVVTHLIDKGSLFSFRRYKTELEAELGESAGIPSKGARTYQDIQSQWLDVEEDLVNITAALWEAYDKGTGAVYEMANEYLEKACAHRTSQEVTDKEARRLLHHMFHTYAYAYLLNTLEIPHEPGAHHIESYLTTGDHSIGERKTVGLGQGDLSRPTAAEILTGRSVLMHSKGLDAGDPIPVVIKLDTERPSSRSVSDEETGVAQGDFREVLDLWPYILVGDIVPVIAIRGKSGENAGGISRVPLSIVQSFGDFAVLLEKQNGSLPDYVYATTSDGKVVLVEAHEILRAGIDFGDDLHRFRKEVERIANERNNPNDQRRYTQYRDAAITS